MNNEKNILLSNTSMGCYSLKNYYRAEITTTINKTRRRIVRDIRKDGYICFGYIIHSLTRRVKYTNLDIKIEIISDPSLITTCNIKHYCFLSKEELDSYLQIINNEYGPFEYTLKKSNVIHFEKEMECFLLEIKSAEITKSKLLWILNLVRHTYEFPFNVFLRDALKLYKSKGFKGEHIANILQIVATLANGDEKAKETYDVIKGLYPTDQSLGPIFRGLEKLSIINEKLELSDSLIYSIYQKNNKHHSTSTYWDSVRRLIFPKSIKIDNEMYLITSFGYWFRSDDWEKARMESYKKYYNLLKKV